MFSWMRIVSILLPLGIIVVVSGAFVVWSQQPGRFPLKTIEVRAELKYVKENEVKTMVSPFLSKGFFWLNVRNVQDSLKKLPWVQSVEVRRIWPDRLLISLEEKTAQATWGDKGVLSTDGVIFYPDVTSIPAKIPRFQGPDNREKDVLQQYFTLLEVLGPVGLTIESLDLSNEGSWRMGLDNGMSVVIGKAAINERMARFILAYPGKLQDKCQQIAYVDLRYANGFAIGWKAGVR